MTRKRIDTSATLCAGEENEKSSVTELCGACGRNHLSACKESRLLGLRRLGKAISSLLWLDVSE